MARLPDEQSVFGGMGPIRSSRPNAGYDVASSVGSALRTAGNAYEQGGQAIARATLRVGADIREMEEQKARQQTAIAQAEFSAKSTELDDEFDKDTKYQDMPERYQKRLEEIRDKAGAGIENGRSRELWRQLSVDNVAKKMARIKGRAEKIEGDTHNGYMLTQLDNLKGQAIRLDDEEERKSKIDAAHGLIDGNRFLTPSARQKLKKDWASDYLEGSVLRHADTNPEEAASRVEKMGNLIDPVRRERMLAQIRRGSDNQKKLVKDAVVDDLASIASTGTASDLPVEKVEKTLGKQFADDWMETRALAQNAWNLTNDFHAIPENEIQKRLEALEPEPGSSNFKVRERLFESAVEKAKAVQKLRLEDPAASVTLDPDVRSASRNANWDDPATVQPLIAARKQAQERAGIPPIAQSVITKQEALQLSAPLAQMVPGNEVKTLTDVSEKFSSLFGSDADEAFSFAIRSRSLDADNKRRATVVARKLALGQNPTPDEVTSANEEASIVASKRMIEPTVHYQPGGVRGGSLSDTGEGNFDTASAPRQSGYPVPNSRHIAELRSNRSNPGMIKQFEAKFGKETTEHILKTYPPVR